MNLVQRCRQAWLEKQAYRWVVNMDEDPIRFGPALDRWIGNDPERLAIYTRAAGSSVTAASAGAQIFGTASQRAASGAKPQIRRRIPLGLFVPVTAAAAVAGVIGFHAYYLPRTGRVATAASGLADHELAYQTAAGEVRQVELTDGSRLILGAGTRVMVRYRKNVRLVDLRSGRVRFEVAHNPAWPFIVQAGGGTVTARGTVFDIDMHGLVRVRLITGAIDVALPRSAAGNAVPPLRHLRSGQLITYDPILASSPTSATTTSQTVASQAVTVKTFDDVPLGQIIEESNRYSVRKILLADTALAARKVFIDVDIHDTQAVAESLALYLGLRLDETQPSTLILRDD